MRIRTQFYTAIVIACAFLATPAMAQEEQYNIKPLQVTPDPNNVDLLSGRFNPDLPVLEVPAAPRLTLGTLQQFDSKVVGQLYSNTDERSESFSLTFGAEVSEAFKCTSNGCMAQNNTGSTFDGQVGNNIFRYVQGKTGISVLYTSKSSYFDYSGVTGSTVPSQTTYYATLIDYPDGETVSITYDKATLQNSVILHRPAKMVSSTGYEMSFSYFSNDSATGASGWSKLKRASIVKTSAPTVILAELNYPTDSNATDLGGRDWHFSGFTNALGANESAKSFTMRGPADTQDQLSISSATRNYAGSYHNDFVTRVTNAGQVYDYTYTGHAEVGFSTARRFSRLVITGPEGYQRTLEYYLKDSPYPHQLIKSDTDSLGNTTHYTYVGNRIDTVTFPEGNKVQFTYDTMGNITSKRAIAKAGSGLADIVERAIYPSAASCTGILCYRPLYTLDAKGNRTDYTFDADHGGLLTRTEPADGNGYQRRTTHSYTLIDGIYRLTKTTVCAIGQCGGAQTQITEYTYSGSTGLIQSKTLTNASGTLSQTTTYTYDAAGRQLIEDGPLTGSDDATSYRYDLSGRPTWEIGARNAAGFYPAQKTTYPTVSTRRTLVQSGTVASRGSTSLTIDTLQTDYLDVNNRVSKSTLAAPSTLTKATQYTYDARGRLRCEATRMNAASFGALPASACTLGSEGSAGPDRITRYSYDANSNLISTLTGLGTAAEGIEQFTAYTANGEVSRREDGNGNSTLYSYDGHDRVYRTTFPDASYEQNSYDANGNLTAFRKRDGVTLIHSYDSQDQRTSSVIPNESTIYFSYDSLGRETQITRGTQVVAYGYDGLGRRISERTNNRTLSYTFDNANRRTRTTFPDGFYVTYNHDAGGRLTNIFENGASAVIDFSYDRAGRVSRIERAGSTITTLNYDGMGRVLDFDHQGFNDSSYSYNPASQLQSKTVSTADYQIQVPTQSTEFYSVNNLNQYTQVTVDGVPEYANYTSAGNLTGFDGWSYVYDAHNRLVTANGSDDTVALSYDATGRLTRTVHNGEIIDYLYDADELVAEYHSNGTLLRRFIHGLGNDDPVIRYEGAGVNARRYLLADERGSIIAEMTANGGLLQAHQYDAYGNPKNSSDARFRFTGQILIPGTELYYYKARVYHPRLGRFMQTDPIGYKDGMNWYAYVGNDPLNMVDSNGRVAESLWDAASLSVGIVSFSKNLYQGNWSAAGVDAIGVIADGAALALPFVPGGAGMAISASRKAESAISGVKFEKQLASESQLTELAEGGGTIISQPAKQADRIAAQHGIDAANVQKVSSSAHKAKDGTSLETHAFRDATTNSVLEPKTIMICTGSRIKRSSC